MSVLNQLPATNLRWCDIRDTLNAHGGNVTNYIQDAFSDGSVTMDSPVPAAHYGICETAAGIAEKAVTITGITSLTAGLLVHVKFLNANSASNPTLKINDLAAVAIVSSHLDTGYYYSFRYNGTSFICCGFRSVTYTPDAKVNKWSCWKPIARGIARGELTAALIKTLRSGLDLDSTFSASNPRGCKFTVSSDASAVKKLTERVLDNLDALPVWSYRASIDSDGGIGFIGDYRSYDPESDPMFDISSITGFKVSRTQSWSASIEQQEQSVGGLVPDDIFSGNHHYGFVIVNYDLWLEQGQLYIEFVKVNATAINADGGTSIATAIGSGAWNPGTATYLFIPLIADTDSADPQYWSQFTDGVSPMSSSTLNDTLLKRLGTIIALDELVKEIYIINSLPLQSYYLKHGKVYNDQTIYELRSTPEFTIQKRHISSESGDISMSEMSAIAFESADGDFNVGAVKSIISIDIALTSMSSMSSNAHWVNILKADDVDGVQMSIQLYVEKIVDDFYFTKARFDWDDTHTEIDLSDEYGDNIWIPTSVVSTTEKPFVRIQVRNYEGSKMYLLIGLKESGSTDCSPDVYDNDLTQPIDLTPGQTGVQYASDGQFVIGYYEGYSMGGLTIKNLSFYALANK